MRQRDRHTQRQRVLASTFKVLKSQPAFKVKTFFALNLLIYAFLITFAMALTYLRTEDALRRGREDRRD